MGKYQFQLSAERVLSPSVLLQVIACILCPPFVIFVIVFNLMRMGNEMKAIDEEAASKNKSSCHYNYKGKIVNQEDNNDIKRKEEVIKKWEQVPGMDHIRKLK